MAVIVSGSTADALLKRIRKAIDEKTIDTWAYDSDGDFYHSPPQWSGRAWLRPSQFQSGLAFGLLGKEGEVMTKEVYAIYHGRFIEMLLAHFDDQFSSAMATAQKDTVDNFKGS